MEGGVEAGDLRQIRPRGGDRTDRREVMRLVQRRQRRQPIQGGQEFGRRRARAGCIARRHARPDGRRRRASPRRGGSQPSRSPSPAGSGNPAPRRPSSAQPAPSPPDPERRNEARGRSPPISPCDTSVRPPGPATSNSENLMLDEPALRVRTASAMTTPSPRFEARPPVGGRSARRRRRRPCASVRHRRGW